MTKITADKPADRIRVSAREGVFHLLASEKTSSAAVQPDHRFSPIPSGAMPDFTSIICNMAILAPISISPMAKPPVP